MCIDGQRRSDDGRQRFFPDERAVKRINVYTIVRIVRYNVKLPSEDNILWVHT